MTNVLLLAGFFGLAAAADALSVRWHTAREADDVPRVAAFSMALECLTWIPIWFALTAEDWRIAAVSIAGSGAGAVWGMRVGRALPQCRSMSPQSQPPNEMRPSDVAPNG